MNRLKELREQKNITQIQLAELLNVTQSAVTKWENGESMPRAEKLIQLAKLFDCTVDELLEKGEWGAILFKKKKEATAKSPLDVAIIITGINVVCFVGNFLIAYLD